MVWPFTSSKPPPPAADAPPIAIHPSSINLHFRDAHTWYVPTEEAQLAAQQTQPPSSTTPPSPPRAPQRYQRLIIACDGTWQSADKLTKAHPDDPDPSNVSRLFNSLRLSEIEEHGEAGEESRGVKEDVITLDNGDRVTQHVLYIQGVGTRGRLDKLTGGAFGWGIERNIFDGYKWLCKHYDHGDEIFLLGFSRGAFTARSIAGFIHDVGLLKIPDDAAFKAAYDEIFTEYKKPVDVWSDDFHERSERRAKRFRRYMDTRGYAFPMYFNVPIKGIGVWDTVGSLGVPVKKGGVVNWVKNKWKWDHNVKYEFHNAALGLGVNNAFQAMGLDEERYAFRPTLWCWPSYPEEIPPDVFNPKSGEHLRTKALLCYAPEPTLYQMWFPGVHIDIGGGTAEGPFPEFSDLTLMWMMRCFSKEGQELLTFKDGAFDKVMHDAATRKPREVTKSTWERVTAAVTEPFWRLFVGPSPAGKTPAAAAAAVSENTPLLRGQQGQTKTPATTTTATASSSSAGESDASNSSDSDDGADVHTPHGDDAPCPTPPQIRKRDRFLQWVTAPISDNSRSATALSGMVPRTPGVWTEFDHPCRSCFSAFKSDPASAAEGCKREFIHHVVRLRWASGNIPQALKGWTFEGSEWVLRSEVDGSVKARIPEFLPSGPEAEFLGRFEEEVEAEVPQEEEVPQAE